ncbi:hypothetical protein [Deinococcus aquiradiocola]|uniref:Uncharacterized protein n=1 Tax=Deinococcus aquiradiocola TaxID=393059 RepID=A0A917UR97_9DEIO|nr:hypothetical protein [Deinococcus aquiradiocola]GGJ78620.1 hypothetical protein GCM10008939_23150 [Deinococcus aquiradiocola]
MKNLMAVMGLILASTSFAQTWDANDGKLTLVGCYGKQDGVYCDFSFTLTKKQTSSLYWHKGDFKVFKQDGASDAADHVTFMDDKYDVFGESSIQEIIANVPVKVQAYFNIPSSTASFRALAFDNVKFDNIPVRAYGVASKVPTQLPAAPGVTGFAISLSNCQLQGQNYVCVATLTPTK